MAAVALRNGLLGTAMFALPVCVWIKDKGYGLYYVSGNSMEPTLRSGDVVLVRKVHLPLHMTTQNDDNKESSSSSNNKSNNTSEINKNSNENGNDGSASINHDSNNNPNNNTQQQLEQQQQQHVFIGNHSFPPNADENWERDLEDAYARRREELSKPRDPRPFAQQQLQWQRSAWWWWGSWGATPVVLQGQIIVFWSPTHYQQLCVKRVIGVGGQIVLPRDFPNKLNLTTLSRRDLNHYLVPPCFWYVEGDNADNSSDSRQYGPIPQRLLVGVVDRIVWPLDRAQPLPRSTASLDNYPITRAWWQ